MPLTDEELRAAFDEPSAEWRSREGMRDAAVLAPWFTRGGEDWLLFTERRGDLPTHAGELSFPGGAREGDEDALACALRETREEIGLDPAVVEPLGRLKPRRSIAGYYVQIFVGRIPGTDGLVPDVREVECLVEIPVARLRDESCWEKREVPPPPFARTLDFLEHDGHTLWGLTAMFARDLVGRLGG